MSEYEKKMHAGEDFSKSIRNVMDAQQNSFSKNFPKVRKLPGIVRSFQETPFKMMLGNYDQLRLGAEYLNKTNNSFLCLDSSGKFWAERQKKNEPKKLNSALVMPPTVKGQSPFPIFEQISVTNKTIDFLGFIQYAWHYMGASINNQEVKFPAVIISDISFANIHSILQFFNQLKIKDYLKIAYKSLAANSKLPLATTMTICESHLLPAILKLSRGAHKNKVVADTLVAGVMVMLQARDLDTAYDIWKNLVKIHCSKRLDADAQENVKKYSYGDSEYDEETLTGFEDDTEEPEEVIKYGKREAIRANSPFYHLFKKPIEKIETEEVDIEEISNPFWCPQLTKIICKQYLALFPLISASVLPDSDSGGLRNNAYVELYWQELRRIFSKLPRRLLWPPAYLGIMHEEMQRKATEILTQKFIPNIRTGGKGKKKAISFIDELDKNIFKPKPAKKNKNVKPKESFNESFEMWDSKKPTKKKEQNTYLKGKIIDYPKIEKANLISNQNKIIVRGPGAASGSLPQSIVIPRENFAKVLTEHTYIDTECVDAGLSLIDRKLSEDCIYVEGVQIYNNTALRLIATGNQSLIKDGPFLAIFPRHLAIQEEEEQMRALSRGENRPDALLGHFTLVSNIHCEAKEVNVYETLIAYRKPHMLLTNEQKKLLKVLCNCENDVLKVNCVNVCPQIESECGAISFGLGVKLCFTVPQERAIYEEFVNVRRDFADCLKLNDLVDFESREVTSQVRFNDNLFSINL